MPSFLGLFAFDAIATSLTKALGCRTHDGTSAELRTASKFFRAA
jgi:hypothetical protein